MFKILERDAGTVVQMSDEAYWPLVMLLWSTRICACMTPMHVFVNSNINEQSTVM